MPMNWAYGGNTNEAESFRAIHRALDVGMTLLDTSDVYGPYTNEDLVGRALEGCRERAVVATKVGLVVGPSGGYPLANDASPEHIRQAVDASLTRLRTDVIDLYQLHRIDPAVPLEDSWGAMAELVTSGKTRALGLSEASIDEMRRAQAIHPVTSVQSELSLWTREHVAEVVPWCGENGVTFIPFSPLGRGFLTGSITRASFEDEDFRAQNPRFTQEAIDANLAIVDRVRAVGDRHGATPAQVAIAWTLAQGDHVIPIPGTRRERYVLENAAAAEIRLSDEDLLELDALPDAAGTRY